MMSCGILFISLYELIVSILLELNRAILLVPLLKKRISTKNIPLFPKGYFL
jgi:hypothetical protein